MHTTAFTTDPDDHRPANESGSRFGEYLRLHRRRFFTDPEASDPEPTRDEHEFALTAFMIAASGIVSPPYLLAHPRVVDTKEDWDTGGVPALIIMLATHRLPALRASLRGYLDWITTPTGALTGPYDHDSPSALTSVTIALPVGHLTLPEPLYDGHTPDAATAIAAVAILAEHANTVLRPMLTELNYNEA